jgi:hypothetical protein
MKIIQRKYSASEGWESPSTDSFEPALADFVLVFGSRKILSDASLFSEIRANYPKAQVLSCSTAGEIFNTEVNDETISLTAIHFEKTTIKCALTEIGKHHNSYAAGKKLTEELIHPGLKYVLVLADGQKVNGSELVSGLMDNLPKDTIITGGLAGDGSRFEKTLIGLNETPGEGKIVVVGFYGEIFITYGSVGGWNSFGPERLITKSKDNVLFELDNKPALDIYKQYLGEYAKDLPGSGLMFPLSIRTNKEDVSIVRTILSVNEKERSLTFAGNMPEGVYARLMKANLDKLVEGASQAARDSINKVVKTPDLAVLISCVGRKLVLNQRIEEEVEVIREIYGDKTVITGFYSYGEISPSLNFTQCELHNQTMTITTLTEK